MRADQILSERSAPVPPRRVPKSVPFSTARSVIFSMAIDRARDPMPRGSHNGVTIQGG